MRPNRAAWVLILGTLALVVPAGQIEPTGGRGVVLLTPEEAQQWHLAEEDWRQPRPRPLLRGLSHGPRVVIQRPPVKDTGDGPIIEAVPPVDFVISFEQNPAPVDMGSLEIKAKKGLLSMSLTDRLKPYVRGESLQAEGVNIPAGKFFIQIEIADTAGTRTIEAYRLEVKRL